MRLLRKPLISLKDLNDKNHVSKFNLTFYNYTQQNMRFRPIEPFKNMCLTLQKPVAQAEPQTLQCL